MPVNPRKNRASSELLYKNNGAQVSMGYRLITTWDVGRKREEFVDHEPQASGLRILRVYQLITHRVYQLEYISF